MNVFCPNCGSPNEAGVKFCWKCGTSLAGLPTSEAGAAEPTAPAPAEPVVPPPAAAEPVVPPPAAPEPVSAPPPPTAAEPVVPPPAAPEPVIAPPPAAPVAAAPVVAPPPPSATQPIPPPPVTQPAAAPPPPPAYAAPVATPAPAGGGPKSRIPMPVMIGGVIAAIVLAAGVGLVFASGNNGPQPTTPGIPTPGPTRSVIATTAPTPGPVVSLQPQPTAGGLNPTPGPVATPNSNNGGTGRVSVDFLAVTIPSTWEVNDQGPTFISTLTAAGGLFYLESGYVENAVTPADLLNAEIQRRKAKYPDVKVCIDELDTNLPQGPDSKGIGLCYTATTSTGKTFKATLYVEYGVSDGGTTVYLMKMFSQAEVWKALVDETIPVWDTVEWKLYKGG